MMKDVPPQAEPTPLNERIARRVRDLRASSGLSLDALAAQCGVSRSMISLVERGESSPTAVLLEKLASGLNVPLAALFDAPDAAAGPVARRADQPSWRDPHSGYVRTNVSPPGWAGPTQIVAVSFPPRARVAYETGARESAVHQQVWLLEGTMHITVGSDMHQLAAGDCVAFRLDQPVSFHNPGRSTARYAVVITVLGSGPTSQRS